MRCRWDKVESRVRSLEVGISFWGGDCVYEEREREGGEGGVSNLLEKLELSE